MKYFLVVAILACVVNGLTAKAALRSPNVQWYLQGTPGFDYDCTGKADGNYPHPSKCTHYVACVAQTEAYEMSCQIGEDGPLHYVQNSGPIENESYCDLPALAGCDGSTPVPITTTTVKPPPEDRECLALHCWNHGFCDRFQTCRHGERIPPSNDWQDWPKCGDDLWWNPDADATQLNIPDQFETYLTGACDIWEKLSNETRDEYLNEPKCIEPCDWAPKDNNECRQSYTFTAPFVGTVHNRTETVHCPANLFWSGTVYNCVGCAEVVRPNGENCCENRS